MAARRRARWASRAPSSPAPWPLAPAPSSPRRYLSPSEPAVSRPPAVKRSVSRPHAVNCSYIRLVSMIWSATAMLAAVLATVLAAVV